MINFTTASQQKPLEPSWVKSHKKPQLCYPITTRISQFLQQLFRFLTQGDQPQVWQVLHQGKSYWNAYDPATGQRVNRLSEAEMRAWIDERYNR